MFKKLFNWATRSSGRFFLRQKHLCKHIDFYPRDTTRVDKVTILGTSNLLGKYLAFLLKRYEIIKELHLYDEANVRGMALDLMHMNTKVKVKPNSGEFSLKYALRHSDIVVITEGYHTILDQNGAGKVRDNAEILYKYAKRIASSCPEALVCIITPPINVMVPIFSEVMKACNAYDPNKIFGVCSLMEMRANSVVAKYLSIDPAAVKVPIVGGASPTTSVPLLSHAKPYNEFTTAEIKKLMTAIQEVSNDCKKAKTAAHLSTAYALARFVLTLANGMCQEKCAIQSAYVRSCVLPQVQYFASAIHTTCKGAVANYGLPKIHDEELNVLCQALMELEAEIALARTIYEELSQTSKGDEIEEICKPVKPFIRKTPCPPSLPCFPDDVCQRQAVKSCCSPIDKQKEQLFPAICCRTCPK